MWSSLGIRNKILLLFVAISIIPLVVVNIIWSRFAQDQLKFAAADRQSVLLASMAQRINSDLSSITNEIVSTSQDISITSLDIDLATVKLLQFSNRENYATRIALANKDGREVIVIEDGSVKEALSNISDSDAFQVVTFLSNEPYISNVRPGDKPSITISVPLLSLGQLGDQDLTNSEALARRYGADISGALIVDVELTSLWDAIKTAQLGDNGYMYLIDQTGNPLVHPREIDRNLNGTEEVTRALEVLKEFDLESVASDFEPAPDISVSEANQVVLSSHFPIAQTKWALIAQEPTTSVYSAVSKIATVAISIMAASVPLAFVLILLATRTLVSPIRQLTEGVLQLSSGTFSGHLDAKGKDELSILARSFNKMGDSLQNVLNKLRQQNVNLEAEQAKLQAVLDTIADGVVVLDQHFSIVLANTTAARFVGSIEAKQLYGRNWLEVFSLFYQDKLFANDLLHDRVHYFHDVTMRTGDDEPKFLDITALRLENDPHGISFILTIQDTTPRRELENMQIDFASMAAHELRTPLTAISGYLNLLAGDDLSSDEYKSYASLANANAVTLEGILNNMLALSRIERKALSLNKKKINWSELVEDEVASLHFFANAKNISITIKKPSSPLFVWGDNAALREVLANLINNAIHYSEKNQAVTISIEEKNATVLTTVSDQGIGIHEKLQSKLFTKYYRTHGGLTTNSQGTGIGLFISKTIIEAHGGTIGVRSTFGEGSHFYFTVEAFDKNKQHDVETNTTLTSGGKVDWFDKSSHS